MKTLLAVLVGLALLGCRAEGPVEDPVQARLKTRLKMWGEDSKTCEHFATERSKARELLAYNPEASRTPLTERLAELKFERHLEKLKEDREKWKKEIALRDADTKACLRGRFWPDAVIEELTAQDRATRARVNDLLEKAR